MIGNVFKLSTVAVLLGVSTGELGAGTQNEVEVAEVRPVAVNDIVPHTGPKLVAVMPLNVAIPVVPEPVALKLGPPSV